MMREYQGKKIVIPPDLEEAMRKHEETLTRVIINMAKKREAKLLKLKGILMEENMNSTTLEHNIHKCCQDHSCKNSEDPWAHRSSGMKCRSCMWFVVKQTKPQMITEAKEYIPQNAITEPVRYINNNRIGRCRRHAPTMNGYPVVYEEDWCGDHKLDENKA